MARYGLRGGVLPRGMMKGRIAIVIHDEQGSLVGYAGRWPGEDVPEGEDRYKLPPGFKKSQVLYNLHRVKGAEELVLVEGYFSVFRLHKLGIPAVALMGRDLSPQQERLLVSSGVKRMVLLLDGDSPSREASAELLPRLTRWFFVRMIDLPEGMQPDAIPEETLRRLLTVRSY